MFRVGSNLKFERPGLCLR